MNERRIIHLETANYLMRTLELADVNDGWGQWLTHPETARMLNAQTRAASTEEIRQYVASFDGHNSHLLGIFEKDGGALIGIRAIYVNWPSKEFIPNVLVGEVHARGKGARQETRDAYFKYFFETLGMQAARITVLAHNEPILKPVRENGWELTGTSFKASATGGAPVEVRAYRLSRDAWARKEAEKAASGG